MEKLPLKDIHLPHSISWWPLAFGWWIMIGLILFGLIIAFIIIRYVMRPSLHREAKMALDRIEKEFHQNGDASESMKEISALLRRVVLSQKGFRDTGGVTGHAWLEYLDKHLDSNEFSDGHGKHLLKGPYQEHYEKKNVPELIDLCRRWIERL